MTASVRHGKEQIKKLKEMYIAKFEIWNDDLCVIINGDKIIGLNEAGKVINWTTVTMTERLETYNKWLTTGMKVDTDIVVYDGREYCIGEYNQYLTWNECWTTNNFSSNNELMQY